MRKRDQDPLFKAYCAQAVKRTKPRRDTAGNVIEFRLTYEEWFKIWEDSGHLEERGRGVGKYCMSRYGDLGHYEIGNVFIQMFSSNSHDSCKAQPAKHQRLLNKSSSKLKRSGSRMSRKEPLTLEDVKEIRANKISGYGLIGPAMKKTAEHYGVSVSTVRRIWDNTWALEKEL